MTSSDITYTPNLHLTKLPSNYRVWAQLMNDNLATLDAAVTGFISFQNLRGAWTNSTVYEAGDSVVDPDTAVIWRNAIDHTSSTIPRTFAEERALFPAYWSIYSTAGTGRGEWTGPGTTYAFNDFVTHGSKYAVCIVAHTSTADFDADVASGYWSVIVDLSTYLPLSGGTLTGNLTVNGTITKANLVEVAGTASSLTIYDAGGGTKNSMGTSAGSFDFRSVSAFNWYSGATPTLRATLSSAGALSITGGLTATTGAFSGTVTGTSISLSGGITLGVGQRLTFTSRGFIDPLNDGLFGLFNNAGTNGVRLDVGTVAGTMQVLQGVGGANTATVRAANGVFDTSMTSASLTANGGPVVVDRTGDAATASVVVAADVSRAANVIFQTTVNPRWSISKNATFEGGANAGSDFAIMAHDDAGVVLSTPLGIARSTGAVTLTPTTAATVPLVANTNINANSYIHVANVHAGATAAAGYGMELSGTANGYALLLVNRAGAGPNLQLSLGPGLTDGFYLPPLTKGTTAAPGTNTTQVATTAFVQAAAAVAGSGVFMAMNNAAWTPVVGVVPFANVITGNSGGWFSTGTNRYTPPSGRYFIYAKITQFATSSGSLAMQLRKNGATVVGTNDTISSGQQGSVIVSGTFDANGTDFFDINISSLGGSGYSGSANMNIFQAHPVSTV